MKNNILIIFLFLITLLIISSCSRPKPDVIVAKKIVQEAQEELEEISEINPKTLLPERCILESGLICKDSKIQREKITIEMLNSRGGAIIVNSIKIGECSSDSINEQLNDGEQKTFVVGGSCDNKGDDGRFKEDIDIGYTDVDTGFSKTSFGSLDVNLE